MQGNIDGPWIDFGDMSDEDVDKVYCRVGLNKGEAGNKLAPGGSGPLSKPTPAVQPWP